MTNATTMTRYEFKRLEKELNQTLDKIDSVVKKLDQYYSRIIEQNSSKAA